MDPMTGAAIAGGAFGLAGDLAGALISSSGSKATNFSNQMFAWNMWREQLDAANHAHQREVKDLQAAGLNPLLSATKGATTPGASSANIQNPKAAFEGAFKRLDPGVILGFQQQRSNISKTNAETSVAIQTAENLKQQNDLIAAQTYESQARAAKVYAEISGKSFIEAGIELFGLSFKYKSETYNNQGTNVPNPAAAADSGSWSHQITNSLVRGEHNF